MAFSELCTTTNFTFLTGASHPEEYVKRAFELNLKSIAITDVNSVAGVVRGHKELVKIKNTLSENQPISSRMIHNKDEKNSVPKLIPGSCLKTNSGILITALPVNKNGWAELCSLLSKGYKYSKKGECNISMKEIVTLSKNLTLLLHPPRNLATSFYKKIWLKDAKFFSNQYKNGYIVLSPKYDDMDKFYFKEVIEIGKKLNLQPIASSNPIMHDSTRRELADILTCIRLKKIIHEIEYEALKNSELCLKSPEEINKIFYHHSKAIQNANYVGRQCNFSLDEIKYNYPSEIFQNETPINRLKRLTKKGLKKRYPNEIPKQVSKQSKKELTLIENLSYEPYFLTVYDLVKFAQKKKILCQGRGSAANSIVCYALGITSVSPEVGSMVFERFVSEARNEPPDIDIDFEHERREEIIEYIYNKYGRDRAGICATVIHYRKKLAVRDVGKAMGLSEIQKSYISTYFNNLSTIDLKKENNDIKNADIQILKSIDLITEIIGFPRHLGQHTGGFVITEEKLNTLVPIENTAIKGRTMISWDKEDIDTLGILKVDILALGMLTCIRKAFELIKETAKHEYTLYTVPQEDLKVYEMLCNADSIGVFQVESRAQMNFLPRLKPKCFYDLVIQTAIVRPGPIQGKMIHPYLRRRSGKEKPVLPEGKLGNVLGKTLGIPLFQEQAMQIAIIGANFTAEEADRLRRSLATFKKTGEISKFRKRFIKGMTQNGYSLEFSKNCFNQIEGFGEYGFPESHAASFAFLVYASAWIKFHYPAIFTCAILNSQPMGFYAPSQIIRDAKEHGVSIHQPCINNSVWDNKVIKNKITGKLDLQLGFRQIKQFSKKYAEIIISKRKYKYESINDLLELKTVPLSVLNLLAKADCFAVLNLSRREASWKLKFLKNNDLPLFQKNMKIYGNNDAKLPEMTLGEELIEDYKSLKLSLKAHPVSLIRHIITPEAA